MLGKIKIRTKLILVLGLFALSLVLSVGIATSLQHQRMLQDRIAKLRAVVEVAVELAQSLDAEVKAGKLPLDQAQAQFKATTRAMWFDDHRSYIAIGGLDGIWFMNASVPKVEGTRGNKMPDGRYILEGFIGSVKSSDEGLVNYDYPKPGATDPLPKLTLVKKFMPWNLVITTGVWIDDLNQDYQAVLLKLAGFSALILAIGAGLIFMVNRDISLSLNSLKKKMESLVAGNLAVDINEVSRRMKSVRWRQRFRSSRTMPSGSRGWSNRKRKRRSARKASAVLRCIPLPGILRPASTASSIPSHRPRRSCKRQPSR